MNALGYEIFGDNGTLIVRNSDTISGSDSLDDILESLRFSGKNVVRVCWHLDEFVAPVIRRLPAKNLAELADKDIKATEYGRYRLYYIPGYLFQVGGVGQRFGTTYFGIKQFLNIVGFPPTPPLDVVGGMGQEILDAIETVGIGGTHVRLTSAGAVFLASDIGRKFMSAIPLGIDIPPQIIRDLTELSALCDDKYWVENRAIGHWNESEIWDYDLTAAFIGRAAKLFDPRDLTFWRSDTMGKREQGALYGMVTGRFHIYPEGEYRHASPIITILPNGLQGTAVGVLDEDTYSLEEIRVVERYGIGEFTQTGMGIFAHTLTSVPPRQPYKEMMEFLYGQRRWSEMAGRISKVAGNAVVGLMIEKRPDAPYRNRFYHALVTSGTRCDITRFLCDNEVTEREVLSIQTDGVKLSRNIDLPNGKKMGTWRNNGSKETIIHSGHRVFVDDKRPGQVDIHDVKQLIAEHPNIQRYSKTAYRYRPMREALDDGDVSKVGEYIPFPVYFDLVKVDLEQTWFFPDYPKSGKEMMATKYYGEPMLLGGG